MSWKEFAAGYLHFTRTDRIGIIVIVVLIFLVFFLPGFFPKTGGKRSPANDTAWITALKKAEHRPNGGNDRQEDFRTEENTAFYQYDRSKDTYGNPPPGELFYFDPNTLPAEGWRKMGLRNKTVQTIRNYLAKGGRFRKPEDFQRIYGLRPAEYERLAPYIRIAAPPQVPDRYYMTDPKPLTAATPRSYAPVDINSADTLAFIALPGIGSKLAARIVNFREKLGGFYSISQLAETYGLPDSTFQKIKPYLQLNNTAIRKININTATVDELKAHPYIRYSIANPIVAYRKEHGSFSKVEDIRKVATVTDEIYNRINPYLDIR